MNKHSLRAEAFREALSRNTRIVPYSHQKISEFFGENVFNIESCKDLSPKTKQQIKEIMQHRAPLTKELAKVVAKAVINWATNKGVTHFCHWFQPLTGSTAEKHDAFLDFDNETLIEKLSSSQLIQGESDASSFPHGGIRSTFEARGYTTWDISSPMFIMEGPNGKVLYIPTAFVSYHGDALDQKTPLLRSLPRLSDAASKFLNLTSGQSDQSQTASDVQVMVGAEQEYFLIDKSFYYLRPDLVMTGRTLIGSLPAKNQQMEDHYFATVEDRVLSFMQELEFELYKIGIPCKTRHKEVAPGQYELAPIFRPANISADQNHAMMIYMKKIALKHNFVMLLHEKPFAHINGSGKHLNWSMMDNHGNNLLSPGNNPHENMRFLAVLSIVIEAFYRHADVIRFSIADYGNDHRLGGHEAPPSIMSVFIGDTLANILHSIKTGASFTPSQKNTLDFKTMHLAQLPQDNTDRNRTSPFAFTGNKFEFRAPGSSKGVGFPITVLNAAVTEVFEEANIFINEKLKDGIKIENILNELIKNNMQNSEKIIFNGDGYDQEWIQEAKRRGLPHLHNTPEALDILGIPERVQFLVKTNILSEREIALRHNIATERYNKMSTIEVKTLRDLVDQHVYPAVFAYKQQLLQIIRDQKDFGLKTTIEMEQFNGLQDYLERLQNHMRELAQEFTEREGKNCTQLSHYFAQTIIPRMREIEEICNALENIVPDTLWSLPKFYEMLFVK